jgi:uncharacterized protein (TIGR01777 family)
MKIVISGSSGLMGQAVAGGLVRQGHQVRYLRRSGVGAGDSDILWNPHQRQIDRQRLEGCEAVIHLAGENIAARRWTPVQKQRILESRVSGTQLLARSLAELAEPPRVMLCASAVGFYGHRGHEWLTEASGPGTGFLAEVCTAWEASAEPACKRGIRVAAMRFGIILSLSGGVLARMLMPFRLGLGGRIGDGTQYMSWISITDCTKAIAYLLTADISGAVNMVSPSPVTNADFTRVLGRVLHRPTLFPVPAFALRLALGEMADALLLASTRVRPARLLDAGFQFQHPDLQGALQAALLQPRKAATS